MHETVADRKARLAEIRRKANAGANLDDPHLYADRNFLLAELDRVGADRDGWRHIAGGQQVSAISAIGQCQDLARDRDAERGVRIAAVEELNRVTAERDVALARVDTALTYIEEYQREEERRDELLSGADHRLAEAKAREAKLAEALDAVWAYEESVQRDLKASAEVGDGTMHKLLRAKDLRAALAEGGEG